jgi:hypothetical protein
MRYAAIKATIYGYAKRSSTTGSFMGSLLLNLVRSYGIRGFMKNSDKKGDEEMYSFNYTGDSDVPVIYKEIPAAEVYKREDYALSMQPGCVRPMAVSHQRVLFHSHFYRTSPMPAFIIVFICFKHQLYLSG